MNFSKKYIYIFLLLVELFEELVTEQNEIIKNNMNNKK
jgi:hypothetical protein